MAVPFILTSQADYPNNVYTITLSNNYVYTNFGLPTVNVLKFQKNYINDVIKSFDFSTFQTYVAYNNLGIGGFVQYGAYPTTATTQYIELVSQVSYVADGYNNTYIVYDAEKLRTTFKLPREFNASYSQIDATTNDSFGYVVYPTRLFLNPAGFTHDPITGNWSLSTNVKLLSTQFITFEDNNPNQYIANLNKTFLSNPPVFYSNADALTFIGNNSYTLSFDLYRTIVVNNKTAIDFNTFSGTTSSGKLDYIFPKIIADSTYVTYSAVYTDFNSSHHIVEQESIDILSKTIASNYILGFDSINNIQKFQLIQNIDSNSTDPAILQTLNNTQFCILSSTLDLDDTTFNFYAKSGKITFIPNTVIGVSYIGTKTSSALGDPATSVTTSTAYPQTVISTNNNIVKFNTPNAPHFYSYKVDLKKTSDGTYQDQFYLNFYVKNKIIAKSSDTTSVTVSSYIASDHNILTYSLEDGGSNDDIKYTIVGVKPNVGIDNIVKSLSAGYYIPPSPFNPSDTGTWVHYDLGYGAWQDAILARNLWISYPSVNLGSVTLYLKTTLRCKTDTTQQSDSHELLEIPLGQGFFDSQSLGNGLFLNTLSEQSNSIVIDASKNTNDNAWPYRDLTNTDISWYFTEVKNGVEQSTIDPALLSNVVINAIDSNNNVLQTITPNSVVNFDSSSWTVNVKGYGPSQINVYLSSAKTGEYNYIGTNPYLFDYFTENKFVITPIVDLNNFNQIRTITLKVQVPFENYLYDIPVDIPVFWEWQYNDITDPLQQPITATYINGNEYQYGFYDSIINLSAISLNILPDIVQSNPRTNKVTISAYTNIKDPFIIGTYDVYVDDFPAISVLNYGFDIYYNKFQQYGIANTKDTGSAIITRPSNYDFYFDFVATNTFTGYYYDNIYWELKDSNNSTPVIKQYLNTDGFNVGYSYDLTHLPASAFYLNLCLISATAPGWSYPHNFITSAVFYKIDPLIFFRPLDFIIYPEYYWDSTGFVTFTTTSNYTQSYCPSGYEHKKSDSYNYWLSANGDGVFNKYYYQNDSTGDTVLTASAFDLLPITYNRVDPAIYLGINITLSAFNDTYFPQSVGNMYLYSDGITNKLLTGYFNNYAYTINQVDLVDGDNLFKMSPVIKSYPDFNFSFILEQQDRINLDIDSTVRVDQQTNPSQYFTPVQIVSGYVKYTLSNEYWSTDSYLDIKALRGTPFTLKTGDPAVLLNTGENGEDSFTISASPVINIQIPPSTFNNYKNLPQYPKDPDLWEIVTLKSP